MISDYFGIATRNLGRRKVRSWLTMIGIFIGIAAIVSLISLGQGLEDAIGRQFELLGTDKIIIMPGRSTLEFGATTATPVTTEDVEVVEKVNGVKLVSPGLYRMARIEYNDKAKYPGLFGFPTDERGEMVYEMVGGVEEGNTLRGQGGHKAIIGWLLAHDTDVFGKQMKIGSSFKADGESFTVVGIMGRVGNPQDDIQIYVPLETMRSLVDEPDDVSFIYAQVSDVNEIDRVADSIERKLRKSRDEEEGDETFNIQTSQQLMESFDTILAIVRWVLIGIAGISLFVGGIGIMNTMYTAVLERTREVGIMKAIGARNSDIFTLFFIESGLLGFVGGAIGVVIGIGLSKIVEFAAVAALDVTYLQASFPWYLIIGALGFSFLVGSLSGTLPAVQASKLKPVEALRYGK